MANKQAKAERSAAKDKRQAPAPDKPVPRMAKRKKKKNYRVLWRSYSRRRGAFHEWATHGYYERLDVAEEAMKRAERKNRQLGLEWEYKIEEL